MTANDPTRVNGPAFIGLTVCDLAKSADLDERVIDSTRDPQELPRAVEFRDGLYPARAKCGSRSHGRRAPQQQHELVVGTRRRGRARRAGRGRRHHGVSTRPWTASERSSRSRIPTATRLRSTRGIGESAGLEGPPRAARRPTRRDCLEPHPGHRDSEC